MSQDSGDGKLNERERGWMRMKSIMDLGMGLLWMGMGVFMLFIKYFNTGLERQYDDPMMKTFGAICLIYGAFRIYRGIKKKYFNS